MTKTLDKGDLQQLALAVSPLEIPFGEALFQVTRVCDIVLLVEKDYVAFHRLDSLRSTWQL